MHWVDVIELARNLHPALLNPNSTVPFQNKLVIVTEIVTWTQEDSDRTDMDWKQILITRSPGI